MVVRTRFAPSPTGYLHVGGLRTALYAYLFAKQNQGQLILRIEDTDQERRVEGAIEKIIEALKWAGLEPDEGPHKGGDYGPYIQSERIELYKKYADELLERDHAYPCFCTKERLDELNRIQKMQNKPPGYDGKCRSLSREEAEQRIAAGESYVIRQKIPENREIIVNDIIRGQVSFETDLLDDQILMKSDGFPTYHLANIVDDHLMEISHVIRGEEWLPSTPKNILLYEFLGWEAPKFAHLPLLLNRDRSKLSKRQGDVAVSDYRDKGYLKDALINFLALLGWNPGTNQEIFSRKELIREFSLEKVGKSGSVFDLEKLDWMNGIYIREMDLDELYQHVEDRIASEIDWSEEELKQIVGLLQESLTKLNDINSKGIIFFKENLQLEKDAEKMLQSKETVKVLKGFIDKLSELDALDRNIFVNIARQVQKETGIKGKQLWMSIRVGITGQTHGPEIHKTAEILGKEKCLERMQEALANA
ncbi:MAG: glutamate--tRNA ligase [Candidatus Marinimicrobia bacterium]|nr:glutamate--tRNA ligase [Candidatus Neomarinimicrobiota bacterium]